MKWRETKGAAEERPSLEAVIEHYGGRSDRQMVPCVLHEDKTPSMSLNLEKQLWNCHSCQRGGDSYRLIMFREEVDFAGARRFAADNGLEPGSADSGGKDVSRGRYSRGSPVPRESGAGAARGGYRPSWRRK